MNHNKFEEGRATMKARRNKTEDKNQDNSVPKALRNCPLWSLPFGLSGKFIFLTSYNCYYHYVSVFCNLYYIITVFQY